MLFKALIDFLKDKSYRGLSITALVILINGTIVYHFVEGWKWLDAFYFSAITLTTVGYGDLAPQTDAGKIFTVVYIFTGIGIIFGFINSFFQHRTKHREELTKKLKDKKESLNAMKR